MRRFRLFEPPKQPQTRSFLVTRLPLISQSPSLGGVSLNFARDRKGSLQIPYLPRPEVVSLQEFEMGSSTLSGPIEDVNLSSIPKRERCLPCRTGRGSCTTS